MPNLWSPANRLESKHRLTSRARMRQPERQARQGAQPASQPKGWTSFHTKPQGTRTQQLKTRHKAPEPENPTYAPGRKDLSTQCQTLKAVARRAPQWQP